MNKKSLFDSTKHEVATSSASKLFNAKLIELQKQRDEQIKRVKKQNKRQGIDKTNVRKELHDLGIKPKVKIKDLALHYYKSTGYNVHEDTMADIINGKATIANQKLEDLKQFLGKQYPEETFFLIFEDDTKAIKYEHDLFFDMLDEAQKQINKFIPSTNSSPRGMSDAVDTISLALGEWGTAKIDQVMKELILEVKKQTAILLPKAQQVSELIEFSDLHPEKSSKDIKLYLYDYMFMMMKQIYAEILSYDHSLAFSHNSFRFQTYNQLTSLNRKRIQDRAVMNLYIIVSLVSMIITQIPSPSLQWYNPQGKEEMLKAISQYIPRAFQGFTEKYGNDFSLNVFS